MMIALRERPRYGDGATGRVVEGARSSPLCGVSLSSPRAIYSPLAPQSPRSPPRPVGSLRYSATLHLPSNVSLVMKNHEPEGSLWMLPTRVRAASTLAGYHK